MLRHFWKNYLISKILFRENSLNVANSEKCNFITRWNFFEEQISRFIDNEKRMEGDCDVN